MKKKMLFTALLLGGALLANGMASAETVSFEGTVAASETCEVYAPIGGTVERVNVSVGEKVNAGYALATLKTVKVYSEEAGTVTGVFGQPGDSADTISKKYGAVMYIEGESVYTIAASTEKAYDADENKFVHVGEEVYLSCYSDGKHTGTGVITAIQGTDFTVEVLSGEFLIGETVSVYRGSEAKAAARIGRGALSRKTPVSVTGSGSIVSYAVKDGDTVARGDLLFETLDGSFDGLYMSGSGITAEVSGTVAQLNLSQGGRLDKGSVAAVIWPDGAMRIEASVSENDLAYIAEGDTVDVELIWNQDEEIVYPGTVTMISHIAESGGQSEQSEGAACYKVYIDFEAGADTRYGMNAVITTVETAGEAAEDETR